MRFECTMLTPLAVAGLVWAVIDGQWDAMQVAIVVIAFDFRLHLK